MHHAVLEETAIWELTYICHVLSHKRRAFRRGPVGIASACQSSVPVWPSTDNHGTLVSQVDRSCLLLLPTAPSVAAPVLGQGGMRPEEEWWPESVWRLTAPNEVIKTMRGARLTRRGLEPLRGHTHTHTLTHTHTGRRCQRDLSVHTMQSGWWRVFVCACVLSG